jgi:hypothetical protein
MQSQGDQKKKKKTGQRIDGYGRERQIIRVAFQTLNVECFLSLSTIGAPNKEARLVALAEHVRDRVFHLLRLRYGRRRRRRRCCCVCRRHGSSVRVAWLPWLRDSRIDRTRNVLNCRSLTGENGNGRSGDLQWCVPMKRKQEKPNGRSGVEPDVFLDRPASISAGSRGGARPE